MSTVVAVAGSQAEADVIVGVLRSHGIRARLAGNDLSDRYPTPLSHGVRVLVPDGKVAKARRIIDGSSGDAPASGELNAFQRLVVRLLGGSLPEARSAGTEDRDLSYSPVGVTLDDAAWAETVAGDQRTYERTVLLGDGDTAWTFASGEVLEWGVKVRSGFTVEAADGASATDARVRAGRRYRLIARIGPLSIREPVEIVGVVDRPERCGFAYGTLHGHPVSGEEAFLIDRLPDGSVMLTLRSLTGPSRGVWRVAYPGILLAQRLYRRRYVRALAFTDATDHPPR